jgi:bifunctional non-homologous end joining protein LigD
MLATLATAPLTSKGLVYEPKYDGIRALVHVERGDTPVRIWSRLGNEKTTQFPSVVKALAPLAKKLRGPLLLDGEIVALDERGNPAGFQRLQGRIHLVGARDVELHDKTQPVALIAFDILRDGNDDLRGLPLTERRQRLEVRLGAFVSPTLRISEQAFGDGQEMDARARREGWEGLIAKEASSPYHSGRRSPAWRKIKLLNEQEFVVSGWTEPRSTRQYFGALLLGVYKDGKLHYVGHTGTGFDQAELSRVSKLLAARAIPASPFAERIKTNEPAHWVRPELVAQVRFTEWTADNKLRHPVYLGLRDDKKPTAVVRESLQASAAPPAPASAARRPTLPSAPGTKARGASARASAPKAAARISRSAAATTAPSPAGATPAMRGRRAASSSTTKPAKPVLDDTNDVVEQLRALEQDRRDGTIALPDGSRLGVTNLAKIYWPGPKLTKGALLRYYAEVAPLILPAVADRPLVMKRYPNGLNGKPFYQQQQRRENPPPGVRVEALPDELDPISDEGAKRFIGGSLITLLYMSQIAAISQDPWFSRVQTPLDADYVAIDLDPGDDTPFARVLDVARWVRDELASLKVPAVPKTSGSSGIHIYIPLPPGTSYESGVLFCQIVATVIATRHPKIATVERTVRARGRGTVYVDYLQNILGKTLATAYSARASDFAGVSTPLDWEELDQKIDPRDYTIVTAPARFREVGDIWSRLRTTKPANLEAVFRKYAGSL